MSPPSYLTGVGGVVWFIATSMLCSFFLTIALLPHSALGAELSLDYRERNSLFGAREGFGVLGTIIAAAAPGFLMQRFGWGERMAFSRLGLVFMIGLVATCWLMVALVYERPEFSQQPPNPLVPGVRRALRNRPFRILLASYIAYTVGSGMGPILLPFFISYVVQPAHPVLWLSIILLVYLGIGFVFIPVGVIAARRWGKLPTLTVCYLIGIGVGLLTFLLVGKGDTGRFLLLVGIGAISFGVSGFLPPSMQAEVIDYDEFHTGRRREAQYAGFWNILPKLAAIPSAALPIALLASLGYVSNAVQKPEVIHAIRILYSLGPAVAAVASLAIVSRFPINAENHAIILNGIERHKRGEQALDPLTGRELPPPDAGNTDEASAWFLDNFSQHELERFITRGSRSAVSDVWRAVALSLAACLIAAWVTLYRIGSAGDPGAIASLGVVASGFALTLFLFHLLRIGPARRLTAGTIPKAVVHAHLENCKQGYI
jgi:glycoside/pentoside/hexuronide:cation symporter, GPH family